jgi:hypothetical protein
VALDSILALNPVNFTWLSQDALDKGVQNGFLAQEVESIIPGVITDAGTSTVVNLDGTVTVITNTKGINYNALWAPTIKAIQEQQLLLGGFASSTATSTTGALSAIPGLHSIIDDVRAENAPDVIDILVAKITSGTRFLTDFTVARITALRGYFEELFAKKIHTDEICVKKSDGTEFCLTGDQLQSMLTASVGSTGGSTASSASGNVGGNGGNTTPQDTTPPVFNFNGAAEHATIQVGSTYVDPTTATDETAPGNPTVTVSINGGVSVEVSSLTLDTSTSTVYTLEYSATDVAGNTAHATRTVTVAE